MSLRGRYLVPAQTAGSMMCCSSPLATGRLARCGRCTRVCTDWLGTAESKRLPAHARDKELGPATCALGCMGVLLYAHERLQSAWVGELGSCVERCTA